MSSPQPASAPSDQNDQANTPSSDQNNPDIRQQVDQGRGTLKKLQLMIPGLRGYRSKEDIRVSDDLLRNQVANNIDLAKTNLEALRKQMVQASDFTNLSTVGSLINQFQQFSGEIRHSQQGYSGIAATFSFDDKRLNQLYEYDYAFVNASFALLNNTSASSLSYDNTNAASIQPKFQNLQTMLSDFKVKWSQRIEAVENILQAKP
jgi:hypothetical protein